MVLAFGSFSNRCSSRPHRVLFFFSTNLQTPLQKERKNNKEKKKKKNYTHACKKRQGKA